MLYCTTLITLCSIIFLDGEQLRNSKRHSKAQYLACFEKNDNGT